MYRLALDPFTPERPLRLAQLAVSFLHSTLEERDNVPIEESRLRLAAMEVESAKTLAAVRYEAERLMYLAERASLDGFPVHDQLVETAAAHEAEIKRLGTEVIGEYKALTKRLNLPQRTQSVMKSGFDLADAFQEGWLTIIKQMRHRAQSIGRRTVHAEPVPAAAGAYLEAAGNPDIRLRPRIADEVIVYEVAIPVPPGLLADAPGLARYADQLHDAVEAALPHLVGLLALRFVPHAHDA
ncbi:MAG TPA: hypothetical protein VED40_02215 [Azospirillaceae bacterium]|nr:hypothetical protein [Azospirillaceae bacterium]